MLALIQRIAEGKVTSEGEVLASCGKGLLILLGVTCEDTEEDGRLLNCYEPGAICCFFDEEPLVFVPLYVTSYNDLAWSVRLDGAAHVLPERWRALLDPCDPSQLVLFHTAADRFHRAMGEDSPILYIRCEDTSAPAAEP